MSLTLSFEKKSGMCSNKLHNVNKGNVILENKEMHLGDLDPARGGYLVGRDTAGQQVRSWENIQLLDRRFIYTATMKSLNA